jgi:hypothetical protein
MRIAIACACALGLVACGPDFLGTGGADAGASSTPDAGTAAPAATGAGCTQDLGGGTKLCTYISVCPSLGVDHDQFPNCGFRIRGDTIDLECVCNGALCPMGSPTSCTQAKELLSSQTELGVCQQIAEGRCTSIGGTPDAGTTSTCDRACAGQCGGDPSCISGCGC